MLLSVLLSSLAGAASSADSAFPHQATSILIMDPETNTVLYQENPDLKLIPASTTKLLPSLAILNTLGPQHRFKTQLFLKKNSARPAEAELILSSEGDPSFTGDDFKQLFTTLKTLKIRNITSFTLVTPKAAGPEIGLGWTQDSLPMCYATPISGFVIDHNCFTVAADSNKKLAQSDDPLLPIQIENRLEWISQDNNECVFEPQITTNKTLTLGGCLPYRNDLTLKFALPLTSRHLSDILASQFKGMNIQWKGSLKMTQTLPQEHGQQIAVHQSAPLQELIYYTLQHSDNLYAEFFLRQLALHHFKVSSFKMGVKALEKHFHPQHFTLQDGSGLSHYNLISARQFAILLTQAYQDRLNFPLWLSFLPVAGQKGSLQPYFKGTPIEGKLMAKTGSLIQVNTLAGYFEYQPGRYWIVVIMAVGKDQKQSFYAQVQSLLSSLSSQK